MSVNGVANSEELLRLAQEAQERLRKQVAAEKTQTTSGTGKPVSDAASKPEQPVSIMTKNQGADTVSPSTSSVSTLTSVTSDKIKAGSMFARSQSNVGEVGDSVKISTQNNPEPSEPKAENEAYATRLSTALGQCDEAIGEHRASDVETYNNLIKSGKSEDEAFEFMGRCERADAQTCNDIMQEHYKEPGFREYVYEHFEDLSPYVQESVSIDLMERYKRGEVSEAEIRKLVPHLKSDKVPNHVKSFFITNAEQMGLPPEKSAKAAEYLGLVRDDMVLRQRLNGKNRTSAKEVLDDKRAGAMLANSETEDNGCAAVEFNKCSSEKVQRSLSTIIPESKSYRNQSVRDAMCESLPDLEENVQAQAYGAAIESEYNTSEDRNNLTAQIKKFDSPDGQEQAVGYANQSTKMDSNNRAYLVKEVKKLAPSIQGRVMSQIISNPLNQKDETIRDAISQTIKELNLSDTQKNELISQHKTAVEAELRRNGVPEETIKAVVDKISSTLSGQVVRAREELNNKLLGACMSAISEELARYGILSHPTSVSQFAELLETGKISPEIVCNAGYKSSLMNNFLALDRDTQNKTLELFSSTDLMQMKERGMIPLRLADKVDELITANPNDATVSYCISHGSLKDKLKLVKNVDKSSQREELSKNIMDNYFVFLDNETKAGMARNIKPSIFS